MSFEGQPLIGHPFGPDSMILPNFLQGIGIDVNQLFQTLADRAPWQDRFESWMRFRHQVIKHEDFFLSDCRGVNGLGQLRDIRKYAYSGAQAETLLHYGAMARLP